MKFVSYEGPGASRRTGVLQDERVVDVSALLAGCPLGAAEAALAGRGIEPASGGLMRWLQADEAARAQVNLRIAEHLAGAAERLPLDSLRLHAPIARPGKIVGVGRNYADHAKETGVDPFEKPRIIFKMPSSVAAPGATVARPANVTKFDFEGELAVVMGRVASKVTPQEALSCVAGYTLLNDLSAREFQFDITPPQTTFAKSMDGFCPLGPALVSADEIPDPQSLTLRTHVNGRLMQEASTADMLFPVATLISYISDYITLEPGDVLATGTPAGIGAFRKPPVWLAPGDRIEVSIEALGTLVTRIG
ncbi:fumarylacetoacetate hydrolase family protein [Ramlibacter rhizophilus]|uniref:FAA hydrolase family protein n=1 Tax=Ramlibacter rhizophilus TaxID=1781167 RepID=A0A4Z0C1J0_9BURK|nr:fumarylacetoacetate hydrolase family protein [Ramlibacter rhizophilus]TFZ04388.1 FAA hydrolase family protein [Ramlibacter rhizophilus]